MWQCLLCEHDFLVYQLEPVGAVNVEADTRLLLAVIPAVIVSFFGEVLEIVTHHRAFLGAPSDEHNAIAFVKSLFLSLVKYWRLSHSQQMHRPLLGAPSDVYNAIAFVHALLSRPIPDF